MRASEYRQSDKENQAPGGCQSQTPNNFKGQNEVAAGGSHDLSYSESVPSSQFLQVQHDFSRVQPDSLPIKYRQNFTVRKTNEETDTPKINNLEN